MPKQVDEIKAYTVAELEPLLKKRAPWIRGEITSGRLPGFRCGTELRVLQDDLLRYSEANRAEGADSRCDPRRNGFRPTSPGRPKKRGKK